MSTTRGNPYGFEQALIWRVDSAGAAVARLDPDNLTPNTTSHAYEVFGPITMTPAQAEFDEFQFRGGGSFEGSADGGLRQVNAGSIQVSQMDAALMAFFMGSNVDTTSLVNASIYAPDSLRPSARQIGLMLIARVQSRESASSGQNKYLHWLYPLVQARMRPPQLTQEGGVNPSPITIDFKAQVAARFPTGVAFGSNQGWYQNSEYQFFINADNPYHLTVYVQNAVATTYIAGYRPVSSTITGGNTTNWHTVDSVVTALSSLSTTTGVATLAAAGTSGKVARLLYQTQRVAI